MMLCRHDSGGQKVGNVDVSDVGEPRNRKSHPSTSDNKRIPAAAVVEVAVVGVAVVGVAVVGVAVVGVAVVGVAVVGVVATTLPAAMVNVWFKNCC